MIITRTPLRISLGGGGTDLKSYYKDHEGFFISAAIDKYVYISLHRTFNPGYIIKYSQIERAERISQIEHPLIRTAFKLHEMEDRIELNSIADIPAGTGLGSSGTFTVGMLRAIAGWNREVTSQQMLAEDACNIEIDHLKRHVGKQDQYIASFGGITCFEIDKKGGVSVSPLRIPKTTLKELEENLLLFFTGYSRSASNILKEQDDKSKKSDKDMISNLHFVKKIGMQSKEALECGDLKRFGELMNQHWEHKKQRSSAMSNPDINKWYETALSNGAIGGKIIGAGGGGFLMFYTEDRNKLIKAMEAEGLQHIDFKFDFEGTKVIIHDQSY